MRLNEKKYVILGSLCALLITMTVAYAAFQTNLKVKGTTNITSNWDVRITNVTETNKNGSAETVGNPTWTETTANIEANLYDKEDYIEYDVTVENKGTLDAKLEGINETLKEENKAVKISIEGYTKGQKLAKGTSQIVKVKIEYNPEFTGEIEEGSTELSLDLNYTQNDDYKKDESGEVTSPDRYLVTYDCTTNGGEKCTNFNEYLKEGEPVNLTNQGKNKKKKFIGWNTDPKAKEGLTELQMGTEEITLYAIYEGDPIIRSWTHTDTSDFHSASYKQSIISAEFLDNKNIPETATESWDVSAAQDGSVMAWVIPDTTDNTKHHLYIGGNGGVIANEDSSNLFVHFNNIELIKFHNNFDTSNATTMENMFHTCTNLKTLDISSFDTSNVANMVSMFYDTRSINKIIGLGNFNTSKVTNFESMFVNCLELTKLNLCSWDTRKATSMKWMFTYSSKLTEIYVGSNWVTTNADTTDMFAGVGTTSVTKSDNCVVEAEDPATIELATSKTTNSITVVTNASAESGIDKYEYQIDGGEWIESTDNIYTFTGLESNTEYTIKVRVTSKVGKQTTSDELKITTNALAIPTFEEIENEANKEVTITYPEGCGKDLTCSYQKDDGDWIETTDTNTKIIFTESGNVVAKVTDGINEVSASHTVIYEGNQLDYLGDVQTFTADKDGYYKVELWGAQGGSTFGGKGAYTSGEIYLETGDTLYLHIGGQGTRITTAGRSAGGYNGGGQGYNVVSGSTVYTGDSGGGATDIRLKNGDWNNTTSLNSRIMVAAGGGGASLSRSGASGGTLIGNSNSGGSTGGLQTSGGIPASLTINGVAGGFGYGGDSGAEAVGGGGSGYYGGAGASQATDNNKGAPGGSSYISGYAGVNGVTSESDRTHTNQTKHYSNKYFINTEMKAGVNSGNGKAKITYLKTPSSKDSTKIKGVRYIKDCISGSSSNTGNHWIELQAINKGINVAKGKTVTGTSSEYTTTPYSRIVDGIMDNIPNYAWTASTGMQCITVDLGKEYDLEEIAVWHYFDDGRTYYNNSTQVAGENEIYRVIYNGEKAETSNGNRIRKDTTMAVKDKNINIGYTKGGTIELSRTKDTMNINATPATEFIYQGATLVCDDKTTKNITGKSFNISDCEGDITVYPKWQKNQYTLQHVDSRSIAMTQDLVDVAGTFSYFSDRHYYQFNVNNSITRVQATSTSPIDITDYDQIYIGTWCNSTSTMFVGVIPSRGTWLHGANVGAGYASVGTTRINIYSNISSRTGYYYVSFQRLKTDSWITSACNIDYTVLTGKTYSYENPY